MRILSLTLENFRSYGDKVRFDFGPRTLIIGENGSGKSTIIDAIEWILTGRCRGVDGSGKGQKDLIRTGAGRMSGTLELDGLDPIKRAYDRSGKASCSLPQDVLLTKLGTTVDYIHAALNGQVFFDLHHADAKNMTMGLLNVRVPKAQLPGLKIAGESAGLDELEQLQATAVQDRLTIKRSLAAVIVPDVQARADLHRVDPAVVRGEVDALAAAYQTAARDEAHAAATVRTLAAQVDAATMAEGNLGSLKAKLEAHRDMLVQERRNLADRKTAAAGLAAAENTADLAAKVTEARTLIQKIEHHDPDRGCVLNPAIPCLTEARRFQGQVAQLQADVDALGKRITTADQQGKAKAQADADVRSAEQAIQYHEKQEADALAKVEQAQTAIAQLESWRADLTTAREAQRTAQAALDAVKRDLDSKQALLGDATTYQAQVGMRDRAEQQRLSLQDDLAQAEQIVTLTGPNGVRLQALEAALADFLAAINQLLAPFGFELIIHVDPWAVSVKNLRTKGVVPYALLSKGEKLFVGLGFQAALAGLSGLDFYAIDDAETVVGKRRGILTKIVMKVPIGQTIVGMAKGIDDAVPTIDGLQVIRLDDAAAGAAA